MRWWLMALCAGAVLSAVNCDKAPAPPPGVGVLAFQKDTACTDTTNTELFVDGTSQGTFTMHPGSITGFNEPAGTHLAHAIERAGKLRDFGVETLVVPDLATVTYNMTCGTGAPPPPQSKRP
jgi:hypothetical protein